MKEKIAFCLNFLWTCFTAFSFPFCFGWIFLDITGHSKGYAYDLGDEKSISIMFGAMELIVWLALSLPSEIYVFRKTISKGRLWLLAPAAVYTALILLYFCVTGGWSVYSKTVFNI